MCGFSYLLASYTANLEKPGLMFAMIFVGPVSVVVGLGRFWNGGDHVIVSFGWSERLEGIIVHGRMVAD